MTEREDWPTPRTDAKFEEFGACSTWCLDFARQLERELATSRGAMLESLSEEAVRQAVARAWCDPANSYKTLDPILIESIVREVLRLNKEKR